MTNQLIKDNHHKWNYGVCDNCGILREVHKVGNTFKTRYYDNRGHELIKPKCSGQFKIKHV